MKTKPMNQNGEIKIEKNVPIPAGHHATTAISMALDKLDPGESFFAPIINSSSLQYFRVKYPDRKFITRKEGDGRRIWRIS